MATSVQDRDQAAPSGVRRAARTGYRWLLLVFLLAVAVQIFLAGLGVFSFGDGDRSGGGHAFSVHQGLGFALAGVSILLLVLAGNTAVFGGLHALDGLLIAASAGVQYALARRR
jgi:hypothetical protein